MKKYLLALLILSLPPLLWWFLPMSIVDGTDIIFPLNPLENLQRGLFAWDPIYNTGSHLNAFQLNLLKFPIYLYLSLFQILHFSLPWINKVWYFTYLFIPALTFFCFLKELFYKNTSKYLISFVAAVFYVYNLYYLQQIFDQAITLSYIFAPLTLFLILRGLRTGKLLLHSILIGLLSFFYSPVNPNSYLVGIIIIISLIVILAAKYLIKKDYGRLYKLLKISLLSGLFSLLVGAYILVPDYYYLNVNASKIQTGSADWLTGVSKTTSFFNVLRLAGAWDWYEKWNGEFYAPYAQVYTQNIFFIILSAIPAVLALLGLIYSKNMWKYFFACLSIIGIVLAMGSHQPTGGIYFFLYNHLPGFWIFRSPWYKFSVFIVFGFAGLIALYAENLTKKFSEKKILITLTAFFILLAFPLFLGTRFTRPSQRHGNLASLQVIIPDYVFETAKWFNKKEGNERILMVPQIAWESTAYNWNYGNLFPPLYTLLEKNPILFLPYDRQGPGTELLKAAKLSFYNPDSTPSANYLAFLNTRYLVNQKDFSYFYFRAPENGENVEKLVNSQKEFSKVESFGNWDIYETEKFLPKIYASGKILKLNSLFEAGGLELSLNPAFILRNEGNLDLEEEFESKTQIIYKQITPTFYRVSVKTSKPFYLIFSESFDKNWVLDFSQEQKYKHFLVNSFANGYLVNKTGEYEIGLKYQPQTFFDKGFTISFYSIITLLMLLAILMIKEKMLKSPKKNP